MKHFTGEILANAPVSESVRRIDFDDAQVNGGFVTGTYFLTVSGKKPYVNMEVGLSPMIYTHRPEYWRIEVVAILPGGGSVPYSVTIPLDGIIGTKGIEVVGATKTQQINIFDENVERCNENGDVRYRANQVPGGVIIFAEGTHPTSGFEVFFDLSPVDVFPPQFILNHRKTDEIVLDVITPFHATTSFKTDGKIDEVVVHDAQGQQKIAVEQTPD